MKEFLVLLRFLFLWFRNVFFHDFLVLVLCYPIVLYFCGVVYARLIKQSSAQAESGGGDKGVQYFDTVNTVSHKLSAFCLSPIVPNALSYPLRGTKS